MLLRAAIRAPARRLATAATRPIARFAMPLSRGISSLARTAAPLATSTRAVVTRSIVAAPRLVPFGRPLHRAMAQYVRFGGGGGGSGSNPFRYRNWSRYLIIAGSGLGVVSLLNIDSVAFTDRKRVILIPTGVERSIGKAGFEQMKAEQARNLLPANHPYTLFVRDIANEIIAGNPTSLPADLKWEIAIIKSPIPNAMVFPGGKIVVYTALIDGLAGKDQRDLVSFVLSHEIGHTVARHTAEKLTTAFALVLPIQIILMQLLDSQYAAQMLTRLLLELPFSRKMESEADTIGLHLLADAGSPAFIKAPEMFRRLEAMKTAAKRGSVPDFLNTHPSDQKRIEQLQRQIPQIVESHRHKLPPAAIHQFESHASSGYALPPPSQPVSRYQSKSKKAAPAESEDAEWK